MFCGDCGKQNAEDYRFCTGCGTPLESGTPDQPIKIEGKSKNINALPHDNQKTRSGEESVPQSKYLSVSWWKDCEWPWQARSLDDQTILGSYQTELEAARIVAKHHGLSSADLLMIRHTSEIEREENINLLLKRVLDKNNNLPEKSKSLTVFSKDSLSYYSPPVLSLYDQNKLYKQEVNKKTSILRRIPKATKEIGADVVRMFKSEHKADELLKWKVLLEKGAITQEEFEEAKRDLLS